jgi:hypothetical protein
MEVRAHQVRSAGTPSTPAATCNDCVSCGQAGSSPALVMPPMIRATGLICRGLAEALSLQSHSATCIVTDRLQDIQAPQDMDGWRASWPAPMPSRILASVSHWKRCGNLLQLFIGQHVFVNRCSLSRRCCISRGERTTLLAGSRTLTAWRCPIWIVQYSVRTFEAPGSRRGKVGGVKRLPEMCVETADRCRCSC